MSEEIQDNVLPENLTNLSFQEIFELRNKIGEKSYNALLTKDEKCTSKAEFHRENKNRPREISSKIRTTIRPTKKLPVENVKPKPIDPRFSHSIGEFNRQAFEENYKFVNRIKKKERKQLLKELENPDIDEDRSNTIKLLLQRMDNQKKEKCKLSQKDKLRNIEREYQINELKQGRQPQYAKKSEKKLFDLVSQFEELKQKGGLIRHIKRRRKKLTQKDRKNLDFLKSSH